MAVDTAAQILDCAERLVQRRGFNGFSYADISTELRLRKASIHYHFATKADLARTLIARYQESFQRALGAIDEGGGDARRKLKRYVELYVEVLRDDRMCLCGMLAADFSTLPAEVREGVTAFFNANEAWLAKVLDEGRRARVLHFEGAVALEARLLLSSLEGAMLVARSYGDPARFEAVARRLLSGLRAKR
jgi:TetR/AcrR family transcriptional repressor of nem operon